MSRSDRTTLLSNVEQEDVMTPMTWDENGKLVPLDAHQQARLSQIAQESARANPPLADNKVLSRRESLRLIWVDVAHLLDAFFKLNHDSLPFIVSATPPIILLLLLAYLTPTAWPILLPAVLTVAGFRLWVWYCLERR